MKGIEFCSVHGRLYTAEQVRPIVLGLLRRKWRGLALRADWRTIVDNTCLRHEPWMRRRNGEVPASLARAVDSDVLHLVLLVGTSPVATRKTEIQHRGTGEMRPTFSSLEESCRQTALARASDRLARGLPVCGHVREDGLGVCAAGPEEICHLPGPHGHAFAPLVDLAILCDG